MAVITSDLGQKTVFVLYMSSRLQRWPHNTHLCPTSSPVPVSNRSPAPNNHHVEKINLAPDMELALKVGIEFWLNLDI